MRSFSQDGRSIDSVPPFSLQLFGGLILTDAGGRPIGAAGRKPLALLALAAAAPSGISRESVMNLLWPDAEPRQARQSLAQAIYTLRQEMGVRAVVGDAVLTADRRVLWTDIDRLDAMLASGDIGSACRLVAAPFLDGVFFRGCATFDHWTDERRRQYRRRVLVACVERARDATDGEGSTTTDLWIAACALDPLDAAVALEGAETLRRLGKRSAALALLTRHVDAMARDLDMAPDDDVQELMLALRDDAVTQAPVEAVQPDHATPPLAAPYDEGGAVASTVVPPRGLSVPLPSPRDARPRSPSRPWHTRPLVVVAAVAAACVVWWAGGRPRRLESMTRTVDLAEALTLRGQAQLAVGREGLLVARALFERALVSDSSYVPAMLGAADATGRLHWFLMERDTARLVEGRRWLARARALGGATGAYHRVQANWSLWVDGNAARAAASQDSAVALGGATPEVLFSRASLRRRVGDWDGALADYRAVVVREPHRYSARLELANTLLLMRRFDDAVPELLRARELEPAAVDPVAWLAAHAVRAHGDGDSAARVIEQAGPLVDASRLFMRLALTFPEVLRALPRDVFAELPRLTVQHALGDTAAFLWVEALRRNEAEDPERRTLLDSARAVLQRQLRARPDDVRARRRFARVLVQMGEGQVALAHLDTALAEATLRRDVMVEADVRRTMAETHRQLGAAGAARAHVDWLLASPSPLTSAVMRVDPLWRDAVAP